jgi:hypothetical protein
MEMFSIEIDEKVWSYLQKHAEPFVDTPNTVLNRILFKTNEKNADIRVLPSVKIHGLPKALSQILEVVYEMKIGGYSRTQATNRVAEKRGTTPQTVTDKYCRQLGQKAHEIDELLAEPGLGRFKDLLKIKFNEHESIIDMYLDTMLTDA